MELENVKVTQSGHSIERCARVKCLGVIIDEGLIWKEHIESVRRKCFRQLARLRRLKDVLPAAVKKKVLPHLPYYTVAGKHKQKMEI